MGLANIEDHVWHCVNLHAIPPQVLAFQENLKGKTWNPNSLSDFKAAFADYQKKFDAYVKVDKAREESRNTLALIRMQRTTQFMTGFNVISMKLKEMYQMITLGG